MNLFILHRRWSVLLAVLSLTLGLLAIIPAASATTHSVATETEFKDALAALSSDVGGPHVVELGADITYAASGHATYTGTQSLTIEGNGYTIDANGMGRILYAPVSSGVVITLRDLTLQGGLTRRPGGTGGAAYVVDGDLEVVNSIVRDNQAGGAGGTGLDDGGGLTVTRGDLTIRDSSVLNNRAEDAAGVSGHNNVLVINSTIANNTADSWEQGGGIFGATVTLINSTVTGNLAGDGAGVYSRGPMSLIYSTVSGNLGGPNVEVTDIGNGSGMTSFGSVVANPHGQNCVIAGGTVSTHSYDDDGTCGFTDSTDTSNGVDPLLGALSDNGGPTHTLAPAITSLLVDAIPIGACSSTYVTDQRGETRPQGTGCDIGAVEITQNQPPVADANGPYMAVEGDTVTFDGSGSWDADNDPLTYTWILTPDDDGFNPSSAVMPTHLFVDDYIGSVGLVVEDGNGASGSDSSTVTISNVSPSIDTLTIVPTLVAAGDSVVAGATFSDPGTADTHTADWNWGDGSIESGTVTQGAGSGSVDDTHTYSVPGIYLVTLTVVDDDGGSDTMAFQYPVVVYDPSAGFVTGGGWIDSPAGAFMDSPLLTGKATFGFVSKYKKGASIPTGNTAFQFHAAGLSFHSTSYDWLVVTGSDYARFKGVGTINGNGAYKFMIWAGDDEPDTFRIKIWTEDFGGNEMVVYDNGSNQAIGGGSIVIHTKKAK